MRSRHGSPDVPLWSDPVGLLQVDKIRHGEFAIDGIPTVAGSRMHHQLLIIGRGRRLWKNIGWVFKRLRDHLGIDIDDWRERRTFFVNYVGIFLSLYRDHVIWMQVLPQRKTFRTLHVDASLYPSQKVVSPKFQFHASCIIDANLELAYNIRIPGSGLLLRGERSLEDFDDELFWTSVLVSRSVSNSQRVSENWYFLAYSWQAEKIRREGTVPILERFFVDQVQTAPLVSFCALNSSGKVVQTHCFSLVPERSVILDLRQSQANLEHHCRSAPHTHSGLGQLLYRERWNR